MTRSRISLHLIALALLAFAAIGTYLVLHSGYAVPRLIHALESADDNERREAAASLVKLGEQALPAVDALLAAARPERSAGDRISAARALTEISPAAAVGLLPRLIDDLRSTEANTRYEGAMTLTELGPLARKALPALVETARDPDEIVRRWAITAIGRIGASSPEAGHAMIAALDDPSEAVRHDALLGFSYGFLPRDVYAQAQPTLRKLAAGGNQAGMAAMTLQQTQQPRSGAAEAQMQTQALRAGGMSARFALQKLALLGHDASTALPAIVAALNDASALNRVLAIEALIAIGPAASNAQSVLRSRLDDADAYVRETAAAAVEALADPNAAERP